MDGGEKVGKEGEGGGDAGHATRENLQRRAPAVEKFGNSISYLARWLLLLGD